MRTFALLVVAAMVTSVSAGAEEVRKARVEPAAAVSDLLWHTLVLRAAAPVTQADFAAQPIRTNLHLRPGMVGAASPRTPDLPSLVLWKRLHQTEANRAVVEALEDLYAAPVVAPTHAENALAWSVMLVEEQLAAGGFVGAGCQCFCNAECDDATFCNGPEVCSGGLCFAGAVPTCADGNPCTTDACSFASDTCLNDPVGPPPEVVNLQVEHPDVAQPETELWWDAQAGASQYNLYRAMLTYLGDLSCFATMPAPMGTDDDPLAPGQLNLYLATSVACGESSLGTSSAGIERINPVPCP